MSQSIVNPLQNLSYTNKDFESVYPEILDLVKELTYKWDPSISNESDPGVILIKLIAILEDKLNYNIDKNVLECFPLSVTQEPNARQLFEQLGYYMKWYRSAKTNVSLKYIGETLSTNSCTIPAFTMVSDSESNLIYTLVGPSEGLADNDFNVSGQSLVFDGTTISFKAIQGIAVKYDVSGVTTISPSMLDSNRRLYFATTDIAENGIFITNVGLNNYSSWIKKDNLIVESLGNTFYKFGVTLDGTSCYIEFPEDVSTIFRDGIEITYIKTLGEDGNTAAFTLEKFYNDLALTCTDNTEIVLNADNVKIQNVSSAADGKNKETINEAYDNYQRTVGTFNTLVTLRDYISAIYNSELVSNDFVCDRSNDAQCSYKIQALTNGVEQETTMIEQIEVSKTTTQGQSVQVYEPALNAFSLKLYLLQYVKDLSTIDNFNKSFDFAASSDIDNLKAYIEENKLMSHDYANILPSSTDNAHFCYFKNKYPITCKIVTQYALNNTQAEEVVENIKQALFKNLNSRQVNFGEAIDIDYIYSIIINADERIKNVILDNINYTTYAVVFDGSDFNSIQLNNLDNSDPVTFESSNPNLTLTTNESTFISKIIEDGYIWKTVFTYSSSGSTWKKGTTSVDLTNYGISVSGTPANNDTITVTVPLRTRLQEEVYTKSVLSGVTQFYVKDETFNYNLDQEITNVITDIKKVKGNLTVNLQSSGSSETYYTLRNKEAIQFYAPNLIDSVNYSNYVKYQYIGTSVSKESSYKLQANEYLILYWKEDDDENSLYSYYCYGQGNIIKPSFNLVQNNDSDIWCTTLTFRNIGTAAKPAYVANSAYYDEMTSERSSTIRLLTNHSLSGTKSIAIQQINAVTLEGSDYQCYWITNNINTDASGNKKSVLFESNETEKILSSTEYFVYSNKSLTDMIILGSGTKITRTTSGVAWSVPVIDASKILADGANYITAEASWFTLPADNPVILTENQFITLNSGCTLYAKGKSSVSGTWKIILSGSDPVIENPIGTVSALTLNNFDLAYTSEANGERVIIGDINLGSEANWNARSYLGVYMSPNEELTLLSNQSLTYIDKDDIEHDPITGQELSSYVYPVCLLASKLINNSSNDFVPVYSVENNELVYPSVYNFKKHITDSASLVKYSSDGNIIITFPASTTLQYKDIIFGLPTGKYILKVTNTSEDCSAMTVSLDGTSLHPIYSSSTDLHLAKTYFISMDINNTTAKTLRVSMTGNTTTSIVTIVNPYKYVKPSYKDSTGTIHTMTDQDFSKYQALINKFDFDHIFNYIYVVPSDKLIKTPLDAKEFNNVYHPYNAYTICQLDTTNSEATILGVNV